MMAEKVNGKEAKKFELNCHGCGACLMSGACLPGYGKDARTVEDTGNGSVAENP
jgi:hypothetical protein